MSDTDLNQLRRWLHALPDVAARTEARLEDLHTIAHERHVGERNTGKGGTPPDELNPLVGSAHARELWRRCAKLAHRALVDLEAVANAIGHYLNDGDPADPTLRGTMLGTDTVSASEELAALVRRQDARRARGDYTPGREMAQPKVPRRG